MTSPLFTAGGSWLPLLLGSVLLLIATVKAVRERKDPRRLILWGALHDAGVACMALTAQTAAGLTGLWLFVIFQISARLLALAASRPAARLWTNCTARDGAIPGPEPFSAWACWPPWAARPFCCPRPAR